MRHTSKSPKRTTDPVQAREVAAPPAFPPPTVAEVAANVRRASDKLQSAREKCLVLLDQARDRLHEINLDATYFADNMQVELPPLEDRVSRALDLVQGFRVILSEEA